VCERYGGWRVMMGTGAGRGDHCVYQNWSSLPAAGHDQRYCAKLFKDESKNMGICISEHIIFQGHTQVSI
jgi:hypothetical protein